MFAAQLLDHFEHPRHAGDLPDADAVVLTENPACGDVLELALKQQGGRLVARFKAKGCVPAMACGSALTELVAGRSRDEALSLTAEAVAQAVGSLPPGSRHAAELAIEALHAALRALR